MLSDEGILACWTLLESAGLPRPWPTEDEAERALSVWSLVLGDVTDERLMALTVAWLRSSEARFGKWPVPGALLAALPQVADIDDADEAWSEALQMLSWRGRDRCPASVAELEDLRGRIVAAIAQADNPDRRYRLQRALGKLPRADEARNEALLAGVAACGGWRTLGSCEDEGTLMAHRASFRNVYRTHRQRNRLTASEREVAALFGGPNLKLIPGCKP